jgi:hypothetical protein
VAPRTLGFAIGSVVEGAHSVFELTVVSQSSDLALALPTLAFHAGCTVDGEPAAKAAATFSQDLRDAIDVLRDLGPQQRPSTYEWLYGDVRSLNQIGCTVAMGLHETTVQDGGPPLRWPVL